MMSEDTDRVRRVISVRHSSKRTSSGKADLGGRRNAESGLSFPKTCSRFMIPEIQSFDGKTGKMLFGYARVSTADQDLTLQMDALAKAEGTNDCRSGSGSRQWREGQRPQAGADAR